MQYGSYESLVVKNRNGMDPHARSCPASVGVHKLVLNMHGLIEGLRFNNFVKW